jgi:hypothetical protein
LVGAAPQQQTEGLLPLLVLLPSVVSVCAAVLLELLVLLWVCVMPCQPAAAAVSA